MIRLLPLNNNGRKSFYIESYCIQKKDNFVAVALNFDLVVQGRTIGGAIDNIDESIVGYLKMCLEDKETDSEIYRDAPKKYFDMYDLFLELEEKEKPKFDAQYLGMKKFSKKSLLHV